MKFEQRVVGGNYLVVALIGAFIWLGILFGMVSPATAGDFRSPEVRVFELQKKGTEQRQQAAFMAFDAEDDHGGAVTLGDVNGDGVEEVIVGSGPGVSPMVRVYSAAGVLLSEFAPYAETMTAGVTVAAGDLDANGKADIVVGTMRGGGPQVRIFDMDGNPQFSTGFFAYNESFRGGVNVAVGNVDGKRGDEIITGAGAGGGPHVRVFDRTGAFTGLDFQPFASTDNGGVSVGIANVDGGKEEEIIMGIHSFGESWVKVYKGTVQRTIVGQFRAYDALYRGGVMVTGADVDRDGVDEIITATRQAGGPHVRFFEGHGALVDAGFMAYEEDFRGGVAIAAGHVDTDSKVEVVTMPQRKIVEGRIDVFQYIDVDISEQTVRAYRNGVKEREFLVSTGIDKYPTPLGDFSVTAKIPVKDYEWSYGPEHPDNYDLKDVRFNLRFRPTYYLHEAYWHNDFGRKRSHGCINISAVNAQWLYEWAHVGTPVFVHE